MMLTTADLDRLAYLARIGLTSDERENLRFQLNQFFCIVEKMCAVDTTGVEPMAHPVAHLVALRSSEDAVAAPESLQANLRNAPASYEGLFLVPKVIE